MLTHQKEYLRLLKEMGPAPGETTTQFANRVVSLEAEAKLLEEQIKGIEENLLGKVATMKVVNRAREARKVGLGGLALQLLLDSDVATYGPAGLELEYELLLFAGRAQELKAWSEPEHISKIGPSTYYWYQTLLDAALGDYAQANADLFALFPSAERIGETKTPVSHRDMIAWSAGQILLNGAPSQGGIRLNRSLKENLDNITRLLFELRTKADLDVYLGLLALENGRSERIGDVFRWCAGHLGPARKGSP